MLSRRPSHTTSSRVSPPKPRLLPAAALSQREEHLAAILGRRGTERLRGPAGQRTLSAQAYARVEQEHCACAVAPYPPATYFTAHALAFPGWFPAGSAGTAQLSSLEGCSGQSAARWVRPFSGPGPRSAGPAAQPGHMAGEP